MKTLFKALLALLAVSSAMAENDSLERRQAASGDRFCFSTTAPTLCIQATVTGTNAQYAVYGSTSTNYYGLGFGRFMNDADIVLMWVNNGKIIISDRYSNFRGNPTVDTVQSITLDATLSKVNADGSFVAVFTRALTAANNQDKTITAGSGPYMAAIGPNPNTADASAVLTYHTFRMTTVTNPFLFPVGGAAVSPSPSKSAAASPSKSATVASPSASPSKSVTVTSPSASPSKGASVSPSPSKAASVSPSPSKGAAASPAASPATSPSSQAVCFTDTPASYCASFAYVTDTDQVRVTLKVESSSYWVGLGIGAEMAGSDTWMAAVSNGQIVLYDGKASGNTQPTKDTTQSLILDNVLSKVNTDGSWTAVFYRAATTGDASDSPIVVKTAADYIWAIGTFTAPSTYSYHSARGTVTTNLFVEADITSADTNQGTTNPTDPADPTDPTDTTPDPTPIPGDINNNTTLTGSSGAVGIGSSSSFGMLGCLLLLLLGLQM